MSRPLFWTLLSFLALFVRMSEECVQTVNSATDEINGKDNDGGTVHLKQPGVLCPEIYPLDSFPPKAPIVPDVFSVAVETVYLKVRCV